MPPGISASRPAVASRSVWDLSICLDCHLRQIRRLNTASRVRSSIEGTTSSKSSAVYRTRRTYATRRDGLLPIKPQCSSSSRYASIPAPRRLSTTSRRHQDMNTSWDRGPTFPPPAPQFKIRRGVKYTFDAPPGSNDVRSKLNAWKPSPDDAVALLFAESDQPKKPGEVSNDLTRPEDLTLSMAGETEDLDDFTLDEDFGDFMSDFDRLSSIAGINDTSIDNTLMSVGDLVHLTSTSQGTPLLACFLGVSLERKFVFYTSLGGIYLSSSRSHEFQVRNYFTAEEFAPLLPFVDEAVDLHGPNVMKDQSKQIPRNIAAPLLRKMNAFRTEVDQYHRQYSGALDKAFETVAHPTEVTFRTLEDIIVAITRLPQPVEGNYPEALQFAISNALKSEKFGFAYEQRLYAYNKVFIILAKNNMSSVLKVQGWLRSYWEEATRVAAGTPVPVVVAEGAAIVRKFQRKTQRIVAESRLHRRSTTFMYPLSCNQGVAPEGDKVFPTVSWSETDRDFIKTLFLHTSAETLKTIANFRSIPASLIKASNSYEEIEEKNLHIGTSWSFLIEIGAVQPFTDVKAFDMAVRPANLALNMSLNKIGTRILAGESLLQAGRLRDSMAEVRKDWGDLPCFCIDKASTVEVDDGISLEPVPGEPGNYWFHTHVVHLSAFVPPTHPIGQCAEHRLSTVYNEAAGTMTMLPPWVGKDFSLGNNKPCMTFSAKFSSEGDILDQKIQPGFLRNVVRMTPESVDKAFGKEGAHSSKVLHSLSVGPHIPAEPKEAEAPQHEITATEKETLSTMLDIMKKYEAKRNGIKYWSMSNKLDLIVQNVKTWPFGVSSPDTWKSEFCLTDPSITINMLDEVEGNFEGTEIPSQTIVEQAMLLAGAIGAKFGAERNIPLVFTGTRSPVNGLESATTLLRELMEQGRVDRNIWREVVSLYATASRTSHPVPQRFLGLPEYARFTSPLRRHFDLLNLWQLDAALLEEHRRSTRPVESPIPEPTTTTSSNPPPATTVNNTTTSSLTQTYAHNPTAPWLPYTRPQLDRLIRICTTRTMTLQWYQNNNRNHWKILALARAFHLQETPLPPRLTALVGKQGKDLQHKARLMEFEMGARLLNRPGEAEQDDGGLKMTTPLEGEIWEIRVHDVEIYMKQVVVVPVRRLARSMREWEAMLRRERVEAEKVAKMEGKEEVEKRMEPLMDDEARLAPR